MKKLINRTKSYYWFLSISIILCTTGCSDDEGTETPVAESIIISSDISESLTMENIVSTEGAPDYIVEGFLEVNADLIINPGVCIEFTANSGLFINNDGTIQASGTSIAPIKFTGVQKVPGFWRGIQVRANDVRNELNHTIVEYAGSDFLATYGTNIEIRGGVAIEGVTGSYGSLKVNNSTIKDCDGYGLIVEQDAQLRAFGNNHFENNELAAIRIDAENVGAIDASSGYTNNGLDGVEINASGSPLHKITQDATWRALESGAVYRVDQSFDVEAELTILPATVIEFEANQTAVFKQDLDTPLGIIIAKGTMSEPITFTGVGKSAGYWQGLIIQSSSALNEMDYCIVEYGGSDPIAGELANIGIDKDGAFGAPELTVTNSIIRHSAGCGIVYEAGSLNYDGTTFSDNASFDVCL